MDGNPTPDPNAAAVAGINKQVANYPQSYMVNALSQMGQAGAGYDFTGLGTADVQNQMSAQMAQTLLDIQNGLGSQYIAQRLQDLQQSDPTGYASYQQLFDQIQADAAKAPPNMPLATATQDAINNVLQTSQTLNPTSMSQVQQGVRGNQVASGIYLGNAPAAAEGAAVVNATDQQNQAAQGAAQQFLQAGTDPADIQYRTTQQNMANLGAFINGQNPTAQFSSLSGAQSQATPTPNTGYSTPGMNEGQAAQQGIDNAYGIYQGQTDWSQNNVNPYMAGLSAASGAASTATSLGWNPWSTYGTTTPQQSQNVSNEYYFGNSEQP
jgi:hypothetical protein